MQALDLTQGFAILAGADAQAGQAPEQAAGSPAFAALVQGLLAVAGEPAAIDRPEDAPAEPAASDAGLTAALDPVDLSVLLSLVAPAPGLHQAPAAQPTTDVPVATGDVSEAPTAAAGSRPGSVDSPTDPRFLHAGGSVDRPIVFERPYSPSPVAVSASQGLGSASPSSAVRDSIAPDVSSLGGTAQGVSSPDRIPRGVTSPDRSMAAPGPAAGEVSAPTGAASVLVSDPSLVSLAEGDPQPASLTEVSPSPGTPAADALTIDSAAPKAPKGPVPAPSRARGAVPRSATLADAAAAALMTVATVTESLEASVPSPAPPIDAHGRAPIETIAVPAAPIRAMARDLARLSSAIIATPVVAATGAIGPGTDGPRQEAGQESNGNAGAPGAHPVVSAPVVADSGWVAQATAAVAAAGDVAGIPVPSSAADAPGAPATAVAAVPSPGAGVGDASLSVVTSTRARQIEALLGAGDPDRQNLHSIVRTIRVTGSADGVSEARLRLQPEHLGQVVLNVRVEQGSVTAHFHAESPEARQWIESHQHELRSALRQQGLEVKELVVSADPDRRQQGRQDEPRERPRQRQRRGEPAAWDAPRFEVTV